MANELMPIYYSGFWDVPHAFLTVFEDKLYYFRRGYFDEALDDCPPNYQVYLVENMNLAEAFEPSKQPSESVKLLNTPLLEESKIVGEIPTKDIIFDKTKRKFIDIIALEMIKPIQQIN